LARGYRYIGSPQAIRFFKFYRSSSLHIFTIPRLKARELQKILYDLIKCNTGACVALEQAAKISL